MLRSRFPSRSISNETNQHTRHAQHTMTPTQGTDVTQASKVGRSTLALIMTATLAFAGAVTPQPAFAADSTPTIVDVSTHGIQPNTGNDAAAAIQATIAKAKESTANGGSAVVRFPQGRYDIYPDKSAERTFYVSDTVGEREAYKNKKIGVLVEDAQNITIDGGGSTFVFHGKMTTFAAIRSTNVTFENFTVDFQVPTVIDLTVESVNGNEATIYVPEAYNYKVANNSVTWLSDISPYTNEPYWMLTNGSTYTQRYDTVAGLTRRGNTQINPIFMGSTITDAGNHRLHVTWHSTPSDEIRPGNSFQIRDTIRDHPGAFLWESKNLTLRNLDMHFLHGFGVVGQHSENITMNDVDFETPPSTGRTSAGFADFIQMSGTKGLIDISGSTFANPHDNPINVHGTFLQVAEKIGPRQVRAQYRYHESTGFPSFYIGDKVEFTQQSTLTPLPNSVATVVAVDGLNSERKKMGEDSGRLTDIILTLDRDIPVAVTPRQTVIENITYAPRIHIHDNVFKETPTRGILVTTRGEVVIENNLFDGMGMAGIFISTNVNNRNGWFESGRATNVTIRNNVFQRSNMQAIFVEHANSSISPDNPVHEKHSITGNTFNMSNKHILDMKSVKGVDFTNNRIIRENPKLSVTLLDTPDTMTVNDSITLQAQARYGIDALRLFKFRASKDIHLHGNTYDAGLNLGSEIGNGMTADQTNFVEDGIAFNADKVVAPTHVLRFTSSDPRVLSIDDSGTVTAKAEGIAHIRTWVTIGERTFPGPWRTIRVNDSTALPADTPLPPLASANDPTSNADAALSTAIISGLNSPFTFEENRLHYFMTAPAETISVPVSFVARDLKATLTLTHNGQSIEPASVIALTPGRNVIEATVVASDGITKNTYRFIIMRAGDANAALASLSVAGKDIELNADSSTYTVEHGNAESVKIEATTISPRATVSIVHNGKVSANGMVALDGGRNVITVIVQTETSAAPTRYQVVVKVPKSDNPSLESLDLGTASLNPVFNSETTAYAVDTNAPSLALKAHAEEKAATVSAHVGDTLVAQAKGMLSTEIGLSEGENTLTLTVTAPNGKAFAVYTLTVNAKGEVSLSDLEWQSATSDNNRSVQRNVSTDQNPLRIWNGIAPQTYAKGLGTHANSTIIYSLADKGFTSFSTIVGVDYETNNKPSEANIIFEVWVDDEKRFTSEEMGTLNAGVSTDAIDVANARTLKLVTKGVRNVWSGHADWAVPTLTLPFAAKQFMVAAASADKAMGTVTLNRSSGTYATGETATVTATPAEGHTFVGWSFADSEPIISNEATLNLKVYTNTSLVARFRSTAPAVVITAGAVSISGDPVVGTTLTAQAGTWAPDKVALNYQWLADGEAINGETGDELALTAALVGAKITVAVTGALEGAEAVTVRSNEVTVRAASTDSASGSGSDSGSGQGNDSGSDSGTGNGSTPPATDTPSVSIRTEGPLRPSQPVSIELAGFAAKETVSLSLHSNPITLGDVTADEFGKVSTTVILPFAAPVGEHHIHAHGLTSGKVARIPVTLLPADQSNTGDANSSTPNAPRPPQKDGSTADAGAGTNTPSTTTPAATAPASTASASKGPSLAFTGTVSVLGLLALTVGGGALATTVRRRA